MSDQDGGLPAYTGDDDETPRFADGDEPTGEPESDVPPASTRILSSLIDAFVVGLLFLAFSAAITAGTKPDSSGKYTSDQLRTLLLWSVAFSIVAAIVIAALQSRGIRTLGKRVTKLQLVGPQGAPPTFLRLLLKYVSMFMIFALLGYLGLIVLLLGLLSAGIQRQRRNVFDQLSGVRPVLA